MNKKRTNGKKYIWQFKDWYFLSKGVAIRQVGNEYAKSLLQEYKQNKIIFRWANSMIRRHELILK